MASTPDALPDEGRCVGEDDGVRCPAAWAVRKHRLCRLHYLRFWRSGGVSAARRRQVLAPYRSPVRSSVRRAHPLDAGGS